MIRIENVSVTYGTGVSEATLANNLKVEVKGSLSTDRTTLTRNLTHWPGAYLRRIA